MPRQHDEVDHLKVHKVSFQMMYKSYFCSMYNRYSYLSNTAKNKECAPCRNGTPPLYLYLKSLIYLSNLFQWSLIIIKILKIVLQKTGTQKNIKTSFGETAKLDLLPGGLNHVINLIIKYDAPDTKNLKITLCCLNRIANRTANLLHLQTRQLPVIILSQIAFCSPIERMSVTTFDMFVFCIWKYDSKQPVISSCACVPF